MPKSRDLVFLLPAALVILGGGVLSIVSNREAIHLVINGWNNPVVDFLFRWWTYLGDGVWAGVLALAFLLYRVRYGLILFSAYALSGLLAQLLKHVFFSDMPRPAKYFELAGKPEALHLVPGVRLYDWHSFPSGHTATAFGVFFALSLLVRDNRIKILCFILAAGVGWSRMVLSQHFLMDVTAGAFLGLSGGYVSWRWLHAKTAPWMDKSLIKIVFS
ncbi:MAG: phosphatase PAP2 family protein [Bacteroidales bacterium]